MMTNNILLFVSAHSPFHTVYTSPLASVCEPSDVSVHSVVTEKDFSLTYKVTTPVQQLYSLTRTNTLTSLRHRDPPSLKVSLHRKLI